MGKLEQSWQLMKASWTVLRQDKELMLFSFLSLLCCGFLCLGFLHAMMPVFAAGEATGPAPEISSLDARSYFILFLFYLAVYLVGTYFSTAVAACAVIRLRGGDPTVRDGLRIATNRLPVILGWALFAATVGILLRMLEDKSKWLGRIVVGLVGMAFSIASFLVVPILALEGVGPIEAFRRSTAMLKKTWGEQLAGSLGFGLVSFLLSLPAILFLVPGMMADTPGSLLTGLVLAGIYLMVVLLAMSTLQTVFQAALYLYANEGQVPQGFSQELLAEAIPSR